jgi:hypothetical protein
LEKIMRSLIFISVLLISAPLMATVNFTVEATGNQVTIGYTSDPGDDVRGVALLLESNLSNTVSSVDSVATAFNTFIDFAYEDPCSYTVGSDGGNLLNCIAKHDGPGVDSPADLPSVVCLGVLDEGGAQAPGPESTANLITLTMSNGSTNTLTISADTLRSETGAVGSDSLATNLPITIEIPTITECAECSDCFPTAHADYAAWLTAGTHMGCSAGRGPAAWCYEFQCKGDTDGQFTGKDKAGKRIYVSSADLETFLAGWQKPETDTGFCGFIAADNDHAFTGKDKAGKRVYVSSADLETFLAGWQTPETDTHFTTSPCF